MTLLGSGAGAAAPPHLNGSAPPPAAATMTVTPARQRRLPPTRQYSDAVRETVRRLVMETDLSIEEISKRTGPSPSTIGNWIRLYGWPRPATAPQPKRRRDDPAALTRHGRMMLRLNRVLSRQLKEIEQRAGNAETAEKDARALAVLAKTYETLTALDRDDEGSTQQAELPNRADVTARLAERIARWAEGRKDGD